MKKRSEVWSTGVVYLLLVMIPSAFFLQFFNRFSGLRSGNGEYFGGMFYLSGIMPYRDYFTTGPPLNLFKSVFLLRCFGPALIVSRSAGVIERLVITIILFWWLRKMFTPMRALIASVVTIVLSAGDLTDPIASYNHDAILWAMLCGLSASLLIEKRRRIVSFLALSATSGAFAALSLMTKQTIGLGVSVAVFVVVGVLLYKLESRSRALAWLGCYSSGAVVPLLALVLYLRRLHTLHDFLQMLFVKGPAAKAGHPSDFLYRELLVALHSLGWVSLGLFGLVLTWKAVRRSVAGEALEGVDAAGSEPSMGRLMLVGGAGLAVIGSGWMLSYTALPALHDFTKGSVYYVFIFLTILLFAFMARLPQPGLSRYRAQCILYCVVSWSVAFMLSLSWPAFEAMLLPGMGFLVACALTGVRVKNLPFLYAGLALIVFMQVREKLDIPFGFDSMHDDRVRLEVASSTLPQLKGMRLTKPTVAFLEDTTRLIAEKTKNTDTIFTYPEMGLLYSLTNRRPPTSSPSHNIDVMNDQFALEEAAKLTAAQPAVIVYYRLTEEQLSSAEIVWRGGRRSGQRDMISAVKRLISGYRLAGTYKLAPDDPEISVYVRP